MVDLPLPVGPVTSARPYGEWIDSIRSVDCRSSKPRPVRFRGMAPLSRIRITIFSPWTVGTVLTRRSIRLSPVRSAMAPSWGMRFSAMSILARTFRRETIMMNTAFDGGGSSWSTPSIRRRNLQPSSNGSRWISLAPLRSACSRIWLTMRTIRPLASAGGEASRLRMFSSSCALVALESHRNPRSLR